MSGRNKTLVSATALLCLTACSAGHGFGLYRAAYDEEGFKCSIREVERGEDFTVLRIEITEPDAQGGIVVAIAAAAIAEDMGMTHFVPLANETAGDGVHFSTIGFTKDPADGARQFEARFDALSRARFESTGYLATAPFKILPAK